MYYNIKIKSQESELSLDSNNRDITEREMDLYFAAIFGASEEFRKNIKEVEIKNTNIKSLDEFENTPEAELKSKFEPIVSPTVITSPPTEPVENKPEPEITVTEADLEQMINDPVMGIEAMLDDVPLTDYETIPKAEASIDFEPEVEIEPEIEGIPVSNQDFSTEIAAQPVPIPEPTVEPEVVLTPVPTAILTPKPSTAEPNLESVKEEKTDTVEPETEIIEEVIEEPQAPTIEDTKEVIIESVAEPTPEPTLEVALEPESIKDYERYVTETVSQEASSNDGIFSRINKKELYNEPIKSEKIDIDKDIETLNSKIALLNAQKAALEKQISISAKLNEKNISDIAEITTPTHPKLETIKVTNVPTEPVVEAVSEFKVVNVPIEPAVEVNLEPETQDTSEVEPVIETKAETEVEIEPEIIETTQVDNIEDEKAISAPESEKEDDIEETVPEPTQSIIDLLNGVENKPEIVLDPDTLEVMLPDIEKIIAETKEVVQKEDSLALLFDNKDDFESDFSLNELASQLNSSEAQKPAPQIDYSEEVTVEMVPTPVATQNIPQSIPVTDAVTAPPLAAIPVQGERIKPKTTSPKAAKEVVDDEPMEKINKKDKSEILADIQANLFDEKLKSEISNDYDFLKDKVQETKKETKPKTNDVTMSCGEYLDNFYCDDIYDEFLACAYYMKHILKEKTFSIKTINAKLYQAREKIANMAIVNTLIENDYIDVIEQEDSNLYAISRDGEMYFKDKLKF